MVRAWSAAAFRKDVDNPYLSSVGILCFSEYRFVFWQLRLETRSFHGTSSFKRQVECCFVLVSFLGGYMVRDDSPKSNIPPLLKRVTQSTVPL